jgi:two-component system sensor histidine kinase KdpD
LTDSSSPNSSVTRLFPKGYLKIFLGSSPGVGKTYAMLQAAAEQKEKGVDVAIGLVETHKRKETEDQLLNLEILNRKIVSYREHTFEELDLDGILARAPKLVLIDECAHSNLPGSRHPKRYNDIEEILEQGISVYTTLNIQHLESLKDIVGQMTHITIRESVPDSFVQSANEIQLIDLPPDDLLQRLADGKVYVPEQVQSARDHFFSRSNLLALRELALRHAVVVADREMADYVQLQGIKGPWPASDKVMVFIDTDPAAPHLVRTAHRVAERLQAQWVAVTVETPDDENRSLDLQRQISGTLQIAEELGAKVIALEGNNIADTLVQYALATNVTDIVIRQTRVGKFRQKLPFGIHFGIYRDIARDILFYRPPLTLRIIPLVQEDSVNQTNSLPLSKHGWMPYCISIITSMVMIGVVKGIAYLTGAIDVTPFFFLSILYISTRFGLKPALLSTFLYTLAYAGYYAKIYNSGINSPKGWLSLILFGLGAIIISTVALQSRTLFSISQGRLRQIRFFSAFVQHLVLCVHKDDILRHLCRQIHIFLKFPVIAFWDNQQHHVPVIRYPETLDVNLTEDDINAVQWTLSRQRRSGRSTENFSDAHYLYLPIKIEESSLGVIGICTIKNHLGIEDYRIAQTLIDQAALAIDRLNYINSARKQK